MLISICICTFNRAHILALCLESLAQLRDPRPKHDLEVIVIDNNSSDGTSDLVQGLIPEYPFRLRYIFEGEQGLSAARNRAIEEAAGDYLAFLDDECTMESCWLLIAILDIEEFNPPFIGGPYVGAFLPGGRPKWFKVEYGNAYFLNQYYERGFQTKFRASGGNMLVRRDVFHKFRFDPGLGMKGNVLRLGEEVDLQDRFLQVHQTEATFYEPRLVLRHFILLEKMTLFYRASRLFSWVLSKPDQISFADFLFAIGKAIFWTAVSPARCMLRNRNEYP
ncbi:MAG: glycosyltransferase family A protein, partial [Saprospiraceae bacterium]|nr:glycosyltransferase family A protein [Saprospiraceae bacterium]